MNVLYMNDDSSLENEDPSLGIEDSSVATTRKFGATSLLTSVAKMMMGARWAGAHGEHRVGFV